MSVFLLVAFAVLPWLGENIYSPGLPLVAQGLGLTPSQGELTLSVYILGLVGGVLAWGPISDKIGRRRAVMCGLLVFTCACTTSFLTSLPWLFFCARFVQGLGVSALIVTGHTLGRQSFQGERRSQVFATIGLAMGLAPAIGPLLGGEIVEIWGWRVSFLVLIGLGLALLAATRLKMPPFSPAPDVTLRFIRWPVLKAVLQDPHFLACGSVCGLCMGAGYSLFSEGPYYFLEGFSFTPAQFGSCFLAVSGGQILGSLCLKMLVKYRSPLQIIAYGSRMLFSIALLWIGLIATGTLQGHGFLGGIESAALLGGVSFSNSFIIGNALAIGLNKVQKSHPITHQYLGTTSSYFAVFLNIVAASVNAIVGLLHTGSLWLLPGMYGVTAGLAVLLIHWVLKSSD